MPVCVGYTDEISRSTDKHQALQCVAAVSHDPRTVGINVIVRICDINQVSHHNHKVNRGYSMIQWPPHSKITCFNSSDEVIAVSKRSRLDLSDSLMLWRKSNDPLFCSIEVSTKDEGWSTWNSENVRKIENHIAYDLEFDAYKVKIERVSRPGKTLCSKPFKWNLEIVADYGEDEPDSGPTRKYSGSRFKAARSDASVKSIQASIEKVFGLPRGCVCLLTQENKKANSNSSIKKLRDKWKNG